MDAPLVITALRIEHDALRRALKGRPVRLMCLGPGPMIERALTPHLTGDLALLAGVAGGLVDDAPASTSRVVDANTGERFTPTVAHDPHGAVIVSTDAPAFTPEAKRRLAEQHGAHLVDNESAPFARACERAGMRWGVLRAVSDGPDEALPEQASRWINDAGSTRITRVVLDTIAHPSLAKDLKRLARNTNRALRELAPRVEQCLDAHT